MAILHIITHYYPVVYGAENFAQNLAQHQTKTDEVHVVTGRWQAEWKNEERYKRVFIHRVSVFRLKYIQTITAVIPFFFKAFQLVVKHNIPIIHTHIYPGMIVGYLLKKIFPKIFFLATIQGGDIGDYDEIYGPFKQLAKKIIAKCLSATDKTHCVSISLKKELLKMGVREDKITVIPNAIYTSKFSPGKNIFTDSIRNKIRLISTSRLEKKNNLESLILAIKKLNNKNNTVSLDIFGTGSLKTTLEKVIAKNRLSKVVRLHSYISQKRLPKIIKKFDIFIRLSTQEGFGISFIEAMAAGLIVVGTNVGAIPEIITHKKDGYLVDISKHIAPQLKKVFTDRSRWLKIKKMAIQTARTRYAWNKLYPKINKLYQQQYELS